VKLDRITFEMRPDIRQPSVQRALCDAIRGRASQWQRRGRCGASGGLNAAFSSYKLTGKQG